MKKIEINSKLYEKVYKEIPDYGRAEFNHCPGIRLYPHYKQYLSGKIMDLGSGTGETVEFFRNKKFEAYGLDWIKPKNIFCKKANITLKNKLDRYDVVTSFDTIEHLTNAQVKALFTNMTVCETQIFTIANTPSIVTLKNGDKIDLHINKKSFDVWRGIIFDYFNIINEISIKDYQRLYICKKKKSTEEYNEYIAEHLRKNGYKVKKWIKGLQQINLNYWYYPVTDFVYDESYVEKYKEYAETTRGEQILNARLNILKSYKNLLDIGIGSGHLIDNKKYAKGYDVNPIVIEKLKKENRWCDPYKESLKHFDVISFFDSFEHIQYPEKILNRITNQTIVIAIPIFNNYENLIQSKHFRPDEHFHYFTFLGFLNYMRNHGFICENISDIEIQLGRESIYTFVFKRGKTE